MGICHLLISLLVAAIVSLGIAQATTGVCPPNCAHCSAVVVPPSCCEDMGGFQNSTHIPGKADERKQQASCDHGFSCFRSSEPVEVIVSLSDSNPEFDAIFSEMISFSLAKYHETYITLSLYSPPLKKSPSLYTLNCSFLI